MRPAYVVSRKMYSALTLGPVLDFLKRKAESTVLVELERVHDVTSCEEPGEHPRKQSPSLIHSPTESYSIRRRRFALVHILRRTNATKMHCSLVQYSIIMSFVG